MRPLYLSLKSYQQLHIGQQYVACKKPVFSGGLTVIPAFGIIIDIVHSMAIGMILKANSRLKNQEQNVIIERKTVWRMNN